MSWQHGLEVLCGAFVLLALPWPALYRRTAFRLRLLRNHSRVWRAANRRRRDVLPSPSEKCRRGAIEAPGRFE